MMTFTIHLITDKSFSDSTRRVHNTMVHNPIYDGPVYESVQPQFDTLTTATKQALESTTLSANQTRTGPPSLQKNSLKPVRYLDQSIQHSQLRSQSFSHSSSSDNDNPRSLSVSVPTARVMALKKNGKERNKFHLTLTLNGSDLSPATDVDNKKGLSTAVPGTSVAADVDENYTVMSPITGTGMVELSPEDTEKYNE